MRQIDLMVSAKKAEWENHMHAVQIQLDKKTKEIEFVKVQLEQKCQEVKLLHIKVLCIETLNCRMRTISQNWLPWADWSVFKVIKGTFTMDLSSKIEKNFNSMSLYIHEHDCR